MLSEIQTLANALEREAGKAQRQFEFFAIFGLATVISGTILSGLFGGIGFGVGISAVVLGAFAVIVAHSAVHKPYLKRAATIVLGKQALNHRPALRRNLSKAFRKNDYGAVTLDKRVEVAREFVDSIGFPRNILSPGDILAVIEKAVGEAAAIDAARFGDLGMVPADPSLFEHWVADRLKISGWDVSVTAASGDQGIDVIARKNDVRVGIQCKLYTGAVGNTAVQEVIAGVIYHDLTKGAVLTNARFTQSAVNLAKSANVILMSRCDLSDPDKKLL